MQRGVPTKNIAPSSMAIGKKNMPHVHGKRLPKKMGLKVWKPFGSTWKLTSKITSPMEKINYKRVSRCSLCGACTLMHIRSLSLRSWYFRCYFHFLSTVIYFLSHTCPVLMVFRNVVKLESVTWLCGQSPA